MNLSVRPLQLGGLLLLIACLPTMASAQAFETGSANLVSVSQSGDLSAIKAQFGEVAKSCKGCHDKFRTK